MVVLCSDGTVDSEIVVVVSVGGVQVLVIALVLVSVLGLVIVVVQLLLLNDPLINATQPLAKESKATHSERKSP